MLDYAVGMTGSASALDLGVRVAVILLALRSPLARLPLALWAVFVTLVLLVDVVRHPAVDWLFATTFPWLTDRRPWQLAVIMTSLLSAIGIAGALAYLHTLVQRLRPRPNLARRLAIGCAILVAFLAEGSAVSIYKRLVQDMDTHYVYSADDRAAMAWLSQHLQPGEVLANDGAVDAGIWAPYKANVPILLPRLGAVDSSTVREPIVSHVLDLEARPTYRSRRLRAQRPLPLPRRARPSLPRPPAAATRRVGAGSQPARSLPQWGCRGVQDRSALRLSRASALVMWLGPEPILSPMSGPLPEGHPSGTSSMARGSTIVNMHPTNLETLVRARSEHLMMEAQRERLAKSLDSHQTRPSITSFFRRPTFSTSPRAQLASQAGC